MSIPVAPDPQDAQHVPVLLDEVLAGLQIQPGARIIDGTLGGGGHTAHLLAHSAPGGSVFGLDADPAAIRRVTDRLANAVATKRLTIVQANFDQMAAEAAAHQVDNVDAILLDLGLSSFQLETPARGFSFQQDGPLDMRFDPTQGASAADIINSWPEQELADVIYQYGEERRSRRIAKVIVRARPIGSTAHLAQIVERAVGGRRGKRTHPATRTFQALRIAVNRELAQLEAVLPQMLTLLKPGGRLAIISFHSLEDRIVKRWMQHEARDYIPEQTHPKGGYTKTPTLRLITTKPIAPTSAEAATNPRSRSAKLRIAERLHAQP